MLTGVAHVTRSLVFVVTVCCAHAGRGNAALLASLAASARDGSGKATEGTSAAAAAFESGFSRGGFESTVEGTSTPAAPTPAQQGAPAQGPVRAATAAEPQAAPTERRTETAAAPATESMPQAGVWGGGGLKSMYAGRFTSSFVPSGSTGGDQSNRATIVAPRAAPNRPVPPPPAPIRPLGKSGAGPGLAFPGCCYGIICSASGAHSCDPYKELWSSSSVLCGSNLTQHAW